MKIRKAIGGTILSWVAICPFILFGMTHGWKFSAIAFGATAALFGLVMLGIWLISSD